MRKKTDNFAQNEQKGGRCASTSPNKTVFTIKEGLLQPARINLSPNCDERSSEQDLSLIIIHNISLPPNEFGGEGIDQLFTNSLNVNEHPFYEEIHELRVSSHLLIRRDGEVVQFVPFHKRAWHAGVSQFLGRDVCNDFSIGIEMEGTDFEPFEENQYKVLHAVLEALIEHYPHLNAESITGHENIAPERKTDPGPYFDWQKVGKYLKVELPAKCKLEYESDNNDGDKGAKGHKMDKGEK